MSVGEHATPVIFPGVLHVGRPGGRLVSLLTDFDAKFSRRASTQVPSKDGDLLPTQRQQALVTKLDFGYQRTWRGKVFG